MAKPLVRMYTDGACSGNPGPGGWAVRLLSGRHVRELSGGERDTTNNRMEMQAVIEGLRALNRSCSVEVCSDSALIVNAFKLGWMQNWLRNGWRKADKSPVENRDLWEAMLKEMQRHEVTFLKVKGHSDDPDNIRVDELAVHAARKAAG